VVFPVSGIEIFPLWPPLMAFGIAFVCSTAGVTGAFLLLPLQISLLGFTGPAVTATNHFYNVFAGAGGAYRYLREGRLLKPLVLMLLIGTVPGIVGGALIRIHFLPDPYYFKLFVGCVLLLMGLYLILQTRLQSHTMMKIPSNAVPPQIEVTGFTALSVDYSFMDKHHSVRVPLVVVFSFMVGLIGGAYGIGGGSINSSFLIGVCGLPVYTTAGATLLATLISSLTGVLCFFSLSFIYSNSGLMITPDWLLGVFFGFGGLLGTYFGARAQRFIPAKVIRTLLAILLLVIAGKYTLEFIGYVNR